MYKILPGEKKKSLLVFKYKSINFVMAGSQDTEGGPLGSESKEPWMRRNKFLYFQHDIYLLFFPAQTTELSYFRKSCLAAS